MMARERTPLAAVVMAVVAIGLVGVLDHVTGFELRLFPLYFVPVAYAAWYAGRPGAACAAVASTISWAFSNWWAGASHEDAHIWPINVAAQLIAMMVVGGLVSELRRRLIAEQALSQRDSLTGLLNRRAFYERAELLFAVARRSNQPIALAYIDLDNFKEVNDASGHEQGDVVLKLVCASLEKDTRETDLVARLGGDEFAILLVDADGDETTRVLERLRAAVADQMRARGLPVTLSTGAIYYAMPPSAIGDAVRAADELMYRVKSGGKNALCVEAR